MCELCAKISESPVQNSSDQSTFRRKMLYESRRFKRFLKTLDGDPGGQPFGDGGHWCRWPRASTPAAGRVA